MNAPRLLVGHANPKNERSVLDWVGNRSWDSFGFAEVEKITAAMHALPQSTFTTSDDDYDRARDVGILVAADRPVRARAAYRVSKALGRPGDDLRRVAPPRTLVEVRYEHPLAEQLDAAGVCHIAFHPNAGPRELNADPRRMTRRALAGLAILREYRSAWKAVTRAVKAARRVGYVVVVTSDAQMTARSPRSWAPRAQARRLGLRAWSVELDWVLYDSRLQLDGRPEVRRLADHPGFIATFVARRRRRPRLRKARR